jgi:hypothetical protein
MTGRKTMTHPTPRPRSRRHVVWLAVLGALLMSLFAPASPTAAQACEPLCIMQASVQTGGTAIGATVRVNTPGGQAWLQVFEDAALTRRVAIAYRQYSSNQFYIQASNLKPGREYHYRLTVQDNHGNQANRVATAKTLRRHVEVTFDRIFVADDGDAGAGELTVNLRAHTTTLFGVFRNRSLSAPASLWPARTIWLTDTPDQVRLSTLVIDDDQGPFDSCPVPELGYNTFGSGSNSCADWATAHVNLNLPANGASGQGNWVGFAAGAVAFQVNGTWKVTYGAW